MTPRDPVEIGVLLSPTWIAGLERAVDLLRTRHPGMPDGELLERIVVAGICSTIDTHLPRHESPFGQVGQQVVGVLR
jgi:hypothetical protein